MNACASFFRLSVLIASAWTALPSLAQSTYEPYTFTTLAGKSPDRPDGTGSNARFTNPQHVAVDSAGNVYVTEEDNTIRKVTPAGVVTTLAGSAHSDNGSADGTGSAAKFSWPSGVAVDSGGNVYVADFGNNAIRKVTPTGVVTTLAGLAGTEGDADGTGNAARFRLSYLSGLAVDSAGNVYVADSLNSKIRKVTPAGVVTTLASGFQFRSGLAVDSAGVVYVADRGMIRKVTPAGMVTTLAGLAGSYDSADGTGSEARFRSPGSVAVDTAGNVYVADTDNHTIRKVTPTGVVTTLAGVVQLGADGSPVGDYADGVGSDARFGHPSGVTVDSAGNVYVADIDNNTIRKVTPAGVVTTLAGLADSSSSSEGTGSEARFRLPRGVAVDAAGNAYVADTGSHAIRKVTPAGAVTTLAGRIGSAGSADGTGDDARFNQPRGVAVDLAGNVYVTDTFNFTIRKVTPAGAVTTLAGLAGSEGSADGTGSDARFGLQVFEGGGPKGLAVDSAGNIFVADSGNSTIRKVTLAGVVTTLAGLAGSGGSADGTGSDARFRIPTGVAVDSAGNVYVADTDNNTIRRGNPALIILKAGFEGPKFALDLAGQMGRCVTLEASINLVNWLPLGTARLSTNQTTMTDPDASRFRVRFYRVSYQPVLLGE